MHIPTIKALKVAQAAGLAAAQVTTGRWAHLPKPLSRALGVVQNVGLLEAYRGLHTPTVRDRM